MKAANTLYMIHVVVVSHIIVLRHRYLKGVYKVHKYYFTCGAVASMFHWVWCKPGWPKILYCNILSNILGVIRCPIFDKYLRRLLVKTQNSKHMFTNYMLF